MNSLEVKCYLCGAVFAVAGLVPTDGFGPVCPNCNEAEEALDGALVQMAAVREAERIVHDNQTKAP